MLNVVGNPVFSISAYLKTEQICLFSLYIVFELKILELSLSCVVNIISY